MRKEIYRMETDDAARMLAAAPFVRIATTRADGAPVLRTVNAVVLDGALYFHGARAGEKVEALDRPAVAAVDEVVASVPSTWVHPELACPATTLYRSVQAHGVLVEETDYPTKVRVLAALLAKLQPEGGYVPLDAAPDRYGPVVRNLLVVRMPLARVDGKAKLAQNRSSDEVVRILDGLWKRGAPGDVRAIELVRRANAHRLASTPSFLEAPEGLSWHVHGDARDAHAAARLLQDAYWMRGASADAVARSHLGADAWVFARDAASGEMVATARAISDGARRAWIYDVIVAERLRGAGLGSRLMTLLERHPALRDVERLELSTRDAAPFYEARGYRDVRTALPVRVGLALVRAAR